MSESKSEDALAAHLAHLEGQLANALDALRELSPAQVIEVLVRDDARGRKSSSRECPVACWLNRRLELTERWVRQFFEGLGATVDEDYAQVEGYVDELRPRWVTTKHVPMPRSVRAVLVAFDAGELPKLNLVDAPSS